MLIREIQQWILNITAFSILLIMIESIMPSGKYKKYIKIVCGFILTIIVIKPVIPLLSGKVDINELIIVNEAKFDDMRINLLTSDFYNKQHDIIVRNYKKNLERQISEYANATTKDYIVNAEAIINEDRKSKDFGKVISLYLTLTPVKKNKIISQYENSNNEESVKPVEEVKIEKIDINKTISNNNTYAQNYSSSKTDDADKMKIQNDLIQKINSVFLIPDEKIYINFDGG